MDDSTADIWETVRRRRQNRAAQSNSVGSPGVQELEGDESELQLECEATG